MEDKLTREEFAKLERIFCPRDIEKIISQFTVQQIRDVINHPTMEK